MNDEARELLGDLIVATVELAQALPIPRFEQAFPVAERWFRLLAMTAAAHPTDAALLDEFAAVLDHDVLGLRRGFEDATWSKITWEHACVARSAFEALRDLFPNHAAIREHADMTRIEDFMIQRGPQRFAPMVIPDGTPRHHWWWFEALPQSERSMVMTERMRNLVPTFTHIASPKFRAVIAEGIVQMTGMVLLRARLPETAMPAPGADPGTVEAAYNRIRLRHVLDPDPSRRPVDLAASALACARHLACELRRPPYPRCKILVQRLEEIVFYQPNAADTDDLDEREPSLAMYSREGVRRAAVPLRFILRTPALTLREARSTLPCALP